MAAGSINSSTLNLVAATMGAGTITMPYIISLTGIAFGSFLIIVGAILSNYSGMLLVSRNQQITLQDKAIDNRRDFFAKTIYKNHLSALNAAPSIIRLHPDLSVSINQPKHFRVPI